MAHHYLCLHCKDSSYIETLIQSLKTSLEKESDDHDVFGAYVAMEMRNLKTTDAQTKLRGEIRDCISRVIREDLMNRLNDGLKMDTVSQEKKKDTWELIN